MTRAERQTMYLETFQKLKEQVAEKIPPVAEKTEDEEEDND